MSGTSNTDPPDLVLPDGSSTAQGDDATTPRGKARMRENDAYVPVIVKRTDETRRHPDDILDAAIEEGLEQLVRPPLSLALSSVAAGLILGFSAMAAAIMTTLTMDLGSEALLRLSTGMVYPFGFVLTVMSGAELFTEHTATAVYPVLDRRARPGALLRLWGIVAGGNLVGAACSATLLLLADPVIGAESGYLAIGDHLTEYAAFPLFVSAVLAGWLMALGAWLIVATPPAVTQLLAIYIVTFLIGLGGLHHSIAGSVEIFAAFGLSEHVKLGDVVRFLGLALAGNTVGGSFFVAVLNWAHIRKSREGET